MINNSTQPSKLDEAVKNALNNYEASGSDADWSKMERMLDSVPKSTTFKWSYSLTMIVGMAVLVGGYFLYTGTKSSKPADTVPAPVVSAPAPATNLTPAPTKTEIIPVATAPVITTPTVATEDKKEPTITETSKATEVVAKEEKKSDAKEKATKETPIKDPNIIAEKNNKKKDKKNKSKETENTTSTDKTTVLGMGNEPIFGDMLDSSRGIVGETKEKEATKKAATSKKNTPVGWDNINFSHINADSLKKYHEQKDSTKVQ